ncbi:VWA domain-containing protein [Rhodococcus rhodnii]|uniref:VWA domain-containing protein n=2 Tax=Rhodococcus rhodnii TaxID=38312 RepID=A0A6P2CFM6_9NOCA|nr:VWA domain-containing protein [Rhodococcus rhodnii]EOM78426.1 putative secreted protein [Rhodococcus rhodnii LMG 5362]TXG91243.1 VWA domain-containing protein [Rhodococcus rhodnii]
MSKGPIIGAVGLVVIVVLVFGWFQLRDRIDEQGAAAAGACVEGDATVHVVADPTIGPALTELAARYTDTAPVVRDHCITIEVATPDPAAAVPALAIGRDAWDDEAMGSPRPALWIPASSATLASAGSGVVDGEPHSIAESPVVLGVPGLLADALTAAGTSWSDLAALQRTDLGELGLPGWGPLGFAASAAPGADASQLALQAVAGATAGVPDGPVTTAIAEAPETRSAFAALVDTEAAKRGPAGPPAATHAVPTIEQTVISGLAADRTADLAAYRPTGTTPVADYPAAVVAGSDETAARAAALFGEFVRSGDAADVLTAAGFRLPDGTAPQSTALDVPDIGARLAPADPEATTALLDAARNPAAPRTTTILLDLSGSMSYAAGSGTRLSTVATALGDEIERLPGATELSLWEFAAGLDGNLPYRVAAPLAPLDENRAAVVSALDDAEPSLGANAYATLQAAYRQAVQNWQPDRTNSILLVTDGPDDSPGVTRASLLAAIDAAADPDRPVAIDVVAIDPEAPVETYRELSESTGGTVVALDDAASGDLAPALADLLS